MLYDCDMFYFGNKEWQEIQLQIEIQICTKFLYLYLCISCVYLYLYLCISCLSLCICICNSGVSVYSHRYWGSIFHNSNFLYLCSGKVVWPLQNYTEAERMMIGLRTETTRRKGGDGICICICIAIGRMVQWSGIKTRNKPKLMRIGRSQQKYTL